MLEFSPLFLKQVLSGVCCSSEEPWHLLVKYKLSDGRGSALSGFPQLLCLWPVHGHRPLNSPSLQGISRQWSFFWWRTANIWELTAFLPKSSLKVNSKHQILEQYHHLCSKLLASDKNCLGKSRQGSFCDKAPWILFQWKWNNVLYCLCQVS